MRKDQIIELRIKELFLAIIREALLGYKYGKDNLRIQEKYFIDSIYMEKICNFLGINKQYILNNMHRLCKGQLRRTN